MTTKDATISAFIASAPPGELANVVNDIKVLAGDEPGILRSLDPAFAKYNEEQYTTVKLPSGSGDQILLSPYNALGDNRYFDAASQTSFTVDHATQQASDSRSHAIDSANADLITSLHKAFQTAAAEHFPSYAVGVYPTKDDAGVALLLVANKYSPQNFWNGRWRSTYIYTPATSSLSGSIKADVHYYEDGNVRMSTSKKSELKVTSSDANQIVREIAKAENKFQEDLNRSFTTLAEGSFKGLRRQLPVTRQRVEWEKIGGYRLGQDIGGGRSK